ncbi:solute carrier organic anion transporter family member 1C1-like isoform X1 [Petromyzon marinus]|uniref:solute carrier organic anion transporter family member 1C1-like isoform X1 n=1 Tax=Petromyzon marinus TaxID=7757 RepID=UPI003F725E91
MSTRLTATCRRTGRPGLCPRTACPGQRRRRRRPRLARLQRAAREARAPGSGCCFLRETSSAGWARRPSPRSESPTWTTSPAARIRRSTSVVCTRWDSWGRCWDSCWDRCAPDSSSTSQIEQAESTFFLPYRDPGLQHHLLDAGGEAASRNIRARRSTNPRRYLHSAGFKGSHVRSGVAAAPAQLDVKLTPADAVLCPPHALVLADRVSLHVQDERWVGAWWLGFLVAGALSLLASLPFWAFPRNLPREKEPRRSSEMNSMPVKEILLTSGDKDECATDFPRRGSHSSTLSTSPTSLIRGVTASLHGVLCQPLVVALLVSQVLQVMSLVGFVTFKPKFMEEQFGKTAAEANMFMGAVNVPSVALGMFGGGLLMRCLALGPLGAARLSLASGSVAWALTLAFYALRCDGPSVVGLTRTPLLASHAGARATGCPGACECRGDAWEPVCGWDGLSYLSPCLAGCNATVAGISTQGGTAPVFTDCACVGGSGGRATPGLCARTASCDRSFHMFLGVTVASSFIYALGSTPAYFIFLRSVNSELKSFALGLQTMVTRTLAGIPAPILYGVAIDSSCTKWGRGTCGLSGVCQLYDTDAFRWIYLTLTFVLRAASLALFAVGCGLLQQQPKRCSMP